MKKSGAPSRWFHGSKELSVSCWGAGPGSQQTPTDFLIYSVLKFPAFKFQSTKAKGFFFFFSCEVIVSIASKYFILISVFFKTFYFKVGSFEVPVQEKKALPITPILSDCCFCKTKFCGVDKHVWIKQLLLVWDFFSEKYSHGFYLRPAVICLKK